MPKTVIASYPDSCLQIEMKATSFTYSAALLHAGNDQPEKGQETK
jgi:hypothetical protein